MKEKVGEVFSIARDNEPVAGCTVSKAVLYTHLRALETEAELVCRLLLEL